MLKWHQGVTRTGGGTCLPQGPTRFEPGSETWKRRENPTVCGRAVLLSSRGVTRGKDELFEPDFVNAAKLVLMRPETQETKH